MSNERPGRHTTQQCDELAAPHACSLNLRITLSTAFLESRVVHHTNRVSKAPQWVTSDQFLRLYRCARSHQPRAVQAGLAERLRSPLVARRDAVPQPGCTGVRSRLWQIGDIVDTLEKWQRGQ